MSDPRKVEYKPLSELSPDPRNPKSHSLEVIDDSIGRFGVLDPIILDQRTGFIVSGHGRAKALKAMEERGEAPPEGVKADPDSGEWLVPVVTGWASRTDAEAGAALIALNRATELGGWVDDALLDLLEELGEEEDGLDGVGFTLKEVEELRSGELWSIDGGAAGAFEDERGLGDFDAEEGDPGKLGGADRGKLLDLAELGLGMPKHETHHRDVWRVGRHILVVANPHKEWDQFVDHLEPGMILAPYPDIWLPTSELAKKSSMVLVQPNLYLAGHTLDKFASVFPDERIEKIA